MFDGVTSPRPISATSFVVTLEDNSKLQQTIDAPAIQLPGVATIYSASR